MVGRPQHLYVFYGLCEKKFVQKLLQLLTIVRRKIRINSLNSACSVNRNYFLFFLLMSKNKSAKPPIAYKFRTALSCQGWYEFACENFVEKNFGCVASRGCSKDSNIFQESSNSELRNHNNVGGTFLSIAPRSCYMWVKSLKRVLYNYMQQCSAEQHMAAWNKSEFLPIRRNTPRNGVDLRVRVFHTWIILTTLFRDEMNIDKQGSSAKVVVYRTALTFCSWEWYYRKVQLYQVFL